MIAPTFWVVDDGPLGDLAVAAEVGWTWPASTLHIVQAVAAAASRDKSGRRSRLLTMSGGTAIAVHAVLEETSASDYLWQHLRKGESSATVNLGEHEAIAWMRHDGPPTSVFVARDKGSAYLALAELGPSRVATPFDLWMELHARGLIDVSSLRALVQRTSSSSGLPVPTRFGL